MGAENGLKKLHQSTQEFHRRLMNQVRVLVVDDERAIGIVLEMALQDEGYQVDVVLSAEDAEERIRAIHYDLLVVDKNLPGRSGVSLIEGLRAAGTVIPSVILTGYPTQQTISQALGSGASDYIAKPFDLRHLVARLKLVIHERLSSLHFGFVAREFKAMIARGGIDAQSKIQVGQAMITAQRSLANRLPAVVVDDDGTTISAELQDAGIRTELISFEQGDEAASKNALVVVVRLRGPESLPLVKSIHQDDLNTEIVVVATDTLPLALLLDAVHAGARDYVQVNEEGVQVLRHRVQQALDRARRRHRNLSLVASLCLVARDQNVEGWEDSLTGLTESDRSYILEALGVAIPASDAGADEDVLDEVLEDLTQSASDLRRATRFNWQQDIWMICSQSEKLSDAYMVQTKASDISINGIFVQDMDLPLGSVVLVQLPASSESQKADIALGRVVRRDDSGVGVEFLRSSEQVEEIIRLLGAASA